MKSKIKTQEEITAISELIREQGKIIVTTNGSFDILHAAHIRLFERAKKEGDCLIVLLNNDASIKRNKGENRPIVREDERAYVLAALQNINYVVIFDEDKPLEILKKIKPHLHAKGGSFIDERIAEEKELISGWGGQYKTFPLEEGFSTTNIINDILNKYGEKSWFYKFPLHYPIPHHTKKHPKYWVFLLSGRSGQD